MASVPMRFADCGLLWQVDKVLSLEACSKLIRSIEAASPGLASSNPEFRDQDRVICDDPDLAQTLMAELRAGLPADVGGLRLVGLNERFRLYRYCPGQRFRPHMDHWYQSDARTISLLTVLVYLNADFEGGQTLFMEQLDAVVKPRAGAAAVFQHKVRHEGCPVTAGVKYALRTDVMYRADSPVVLTHAD